MPVVLTFFLYLFQFHNVNHIPHKANTIRDGDKPVALRCSTNCGSPCTDALTDGDRDGLTFIYAALLQHG